MAAYSTQMHEDCWVGYMQVRLDRAVMTFREQLGHPLYPLFKLGYTDLAVFESRFFLESISFLSLSNLYPTILLRTVHKKLEFSKYPQEVTYQG